MLNFIGIALVSYFTQYYYKFPGDAIHADGRDRAGRAHSAAQPVFAVHTDRCSAQRCVFIIAILMCFSFTFFSGKQNGDTNCGRSAKIRRRRNTAAFRQKTDRYRDDDLGRLGRDGGDRRGLGLRGTIITTDFRRNGGFLGIAVALLGPKSSARRFYRRDIFRGAAARRDICRCLHANVSKDLGWVLQAIIIFLSRVFRCIRGEDKRTKYERRSLHLHCYFRRFGWRRR